MTILTHEQMMALTLLTVNSGAYRGVIMSKFAGSDEFKVVGLPDALPDEYKHLLIAAPLLYQTLEKCKTAFEALERATEESGDHKSSAALLQLQSVIKLSQDISLLGVDNFNKAKQVRTT